MTYRVVQWATGAVGLAALRGVLARPDCELVGLRVYSPHKEGRDAGELAGTEAVGVLGTASTDEILALDADAVLYTPGTPSLDEVGALLASGKDVLTSAFLFHPARLRPADRDRLQAACRAGGATLHGSGINPGALGTVLPLALSGLTRRLDRVTVQERADWSLYGNTSMTFDKMGFGGPPERVSAVTNPFLAFNSELFSQQVWSVADGLGAAVDLVTADVDVVLAHRDHALPDRTLRAGTVAGQRWRWTALSSGRPVVEMESLWTVGRDYPQQWPAPEHGWTVTLEGEPSVRVHALVLASFTRAASVEEHVQSSSEATALQLVNAVPAVCGAPPGFASSADLPLVRNPYALATLPSKRLFHGTPTEMMPS